jgi:hypothetical protein
MCAQYLWRVKVLAVTSRMSSKCDDVPTAWRNSHGKPCWRPSQCTQIYSSWPCRARLRSIDPVLKEGQVVYLFEGNMQQWQAAKVAPHARLTSVQFDTKRSTLGLCADLQKCQTGNLSMQLPHKCADEETHWSVLGNFVI